MRTIIALGALLGALAAPAPAQQGGAAMQNGPVIMKSGSYSPVPDATFKVPADLDYKVFWDVHVGAAKPGDVNPAYEVPSRFINQGAVIGVPRRNVHVALVIHGTAGEDILNNAEYRARKGVDNPNIPLLEEMAKAGVQIILCGQTAAKQKLTRDTILPFVLVAPSAAWAEAVLLRQGYTANPF